MFCRWLLTGWMAEGSEAAGDALHHVGFPCGEVAGEDVAPCFAHEPEIEGEVVDRGYLHGQQLLADEEMAEVGAGVYAVDVARTVGIDGREIVGPFLVAHVHDAVGGEEHAVAAVACRHHAVHHVDAAVDGFEDVGGGAHAHEIAGLVGGEYLVDHLDHLIHPLGGLAYGQTAYGVAVGAEVADEFCRLAAQVGEPHALHYGEIGLRIAVEAFGLLIAFPAALKPAVGESERFPGVGIVSHAGGTFVESHHDVGADGALDIHDSLGGEEVSRAVDVRAEVGALFGEFALSRQGKDLKAAAVGEDRPLPAVELVETAGATDYFGAGPQVEVIGVAQDDLCLYVVAKLMLMHALDTAESAYGHEYGGENLAMIGGNLARTGIGALRSSL